MNNFLSLGNEEPGLAMFQGAFEGPIRLKLWKLDGVDAQDIEGHGLRTVR
jgi:hypothetical protein